MLGSTFTSFAQTLVNLGRLDEAEQMRQRMQTLWAKRRRRSSRKPVRNPQNVPGPSWPALIRLTAVPAPISFSVGRSSRRAIFGSSATSSEER
jgi:pentatricopeptide repeat protein